MLCVCYRWETAKVMAISISASHVLCLLQVVDHQGHGYRYQRVSCSVSVIGGRPSRSWLSVSARLMFCVCYRWETIKVMAIGIGASHSLCLLQVVDHQGHGYRYQRVSCSVSVAGGRPSRSWLSVSVRLMFCVCYRWETIKVMAIGISASHVLCLLQVGDHQGHGHRYRRGHGRPHAHPVPRAVV